jgi:hypothetical protein
MTLKIGQLTLNPKFEYRNAKQIIMTKKSNYKQYDLEDRTAYAKSEIRISKCETNHND